MNPDLRLSRGSGPWAVECIDYVIRAASRDAAERALAELIRTGHCHNEHTVTGPS
jgi:hypothetical protein